MSRPISEGPPVRSIVFASILTALMCVGSYIAIPVGPVPIVLQNLFVILAALVLGPVWGTVSVVLFLLIGILGLPVFSGGGAGFAHVAGPTGGYLLGYLPAVAVMGLTAARRKPVTDALAGVVGSLIIYACGVPWLAWVTGMELQRAFTVGMLPFLIGDGLKIAVSGSSGPLLEAHSRGRPVSLIQIRDLGHQFPDGTRALRNVDLSISRGEFVVLTGRNGSGKTVLVRHLNGLLEPTTGWVSIDGRRVSENPSLSRQRVGMVFQDADSQIVAETVAEEISFGPRNLGWKPLRVEEAVEMVLQRMGLAELKHREPHRLSGGEKRRLAIAGVLVMNPDVLVLDEPLATLDYPGVVEVLTALKSLHQEGHTIIVITHDLSRVLGLAGRLIVMSSGRIVLDGVPGDLLPELERHGVRAPLGGETASWLA